MSKIEWTDETWNPLVGCSVISPGCTNCYAMRVAARNAAMNPGLERYHGLTKPSKAGPVWTGKIGIAPDEVLTKPLRWKRPRMIFVNSMSDLFHEAVPDEVINRIFAVMALSPQHIFQVLTKRSARMREYLSSRDTIRRVMNEAEHDCEKLGKGDLHRWLRNADARMVAMRNGSAPGIWPLPNVWLGVSVEDQARAEERIPDLLDTPAAVRWISAEPLLGPVDLSRISESEGELLTPEQIAAGETAFGWYIDALAGDAWDDENGALTGEYRDRFGSARLNWVVAGGESGKGARPMHPDWARRLRDQCATAGVPFFFKQWGEWAPPETALRRHIKIIRGRAFYSDETCARWMPNGREGAGWRRMGPPEEVDSEEADTYLIGKRRAGRMLDGVEHNAMPEGGE